MLLKQLFKRKSRNIISLSREIIPLTNITFLLFDEKSGKLLKRKDVHNDLMTTGLTYYAQTMVRANPTNLFGSLYLGNTVAPAIDPADDFSNFSLIAGSEKVQQPGYPRISDPDPDNIGSGTNVCSRQYIYSGADGNWTGITEIVISTPGASGSDPILNHALMPDAPLTKTSDQLLKVIVNHALAAV